MLNREDIRRVLVARDKIVSRYIEDSIEDVTTKQLCEDILREVQIVTEFENRSKK